MNTQKKLFLLDAYALIYRAYFAFIKNPRINSKGINTSAIFGFTNTLMEILKKEKPTHLAVVFDTKEPTARHIEYPEYKAQRESMPEDLSASLPYIDRLLEALNIPKLFKRGYEADDVIGTLAKKAENEGFQVFMMTSDKDFAQLVSKNIFMYRPATKWRGNEIWGIKEVLDKFQVKHVSQIIDLLGMMGDASDNIPGIPGVGQKTAVKFLTEYGSMEKLFENLAKLKGKMKENVEKGMEIGSLSKKLVTIITDVPIEINIEDLSIKARNASSLKSLFQELEFRRFLNTFFEQKITQKENVSKNDLPKIKDIQMNLFDPSEEAHKESNLSGKNYQLCNTLKKTELLANSLKNEKIIAIELIASEDNFYSAELIGIAFSAEKNKGSFVPLTESNQNLLLNCFKPLFENKKLKFIGYNIKKQLKIFSKKNIDIKAELFDIRIAHYLLYPDIRHNLDLIAESVLGEHLTTLQELQGKGKLKKQISEITQENLKNCIVRYSDIIFQIYPILKKELIQNEVWDLFTQIEMPLIKVLTAMEIEGIGIDKGVLEAYSKTLEKVELDCSLKIYKLANMEFNINSPKQLGGILFDRMNLDKKVKKTKSGNYSTSEDTLVKIKNKHPIIEIILEYREIKKLLSTYVKALPELVFKQRVHTTFSQSVAATGRLSSTSPNLQNIPIRTVRGKKIREAFTPKNNEYQLLSADYSQIELRIMASLSKDDQMIQAFNRGEDIHAATAAKVYKIPIEDVTRIMRSNAKSVNFGIIYGISAFGLAQNIGSSRKEAKEIIDQYFKQFPKIKEYMDWSIAKAREKEYAETIFGRKRLLRDINSKNAVIRSVAERNAINMPIQGSAADIIKKAMIEIQQEITEKQLESKMLLQVHDELVFDMQKEEEEVLKKLVKEKMEKSTRLSVPLVVDIGIGKNWLEAH